MYLFQLTRFAKICQIMTTQALTHMAYPWQIKSVFVIKIFLLKCPVLLDFCVKQSWVDLQILSCRADGLFATLSYASTNKCPDSLRFFCKMLLKNVPLTKNLMRSLRHYYFRLLNWWMITSKHISHNGGRWG